MTLEEMKELKEKNGWTLNALAQYSGVPLGTLQKIFSGETEKPRYQTRKALEGALVREAALSYGEARQKPKGDCTLEDYYLLPEERRAELIDGVLYDMAAPSFVHQSIVSYVFFEISAYIRRKQGACVPMVSPVAVRLDRDDRTMVEPDILILCDQEKIRRWGIDGAPDFILEVVSCSSRRRDYIIKAEKYMSAGVKEYWIVDPEKRMLLTYDFQKDCMPRLTPLAGREPVALYQGELRIDLDELNSLIREDLKDE